jgi:hypothetical protein
LRLQEREQIVAFSVLDRKETREQGADREKQKYGDCDEGGPFQTRGYRTPG